MKPNTLLSHEAMEHLIEVFAIVLALIIWWMVMAPIVI